MEEMEKEMTKDELLTCWLTLQVKMVGNKVTVRILTSRTCCMLKYSLMVPVSKGRKEGQ